MSNIEKFAQEFAALFREEGIDDFSQFLSTVDLFDETPLYSRYSQLRFLNDLPIGEQNRLLIQAGALLLARLVSHIEDLRTSGAVDAFCMLTISDWEDWDDTGGQELLTPALWFTNPSRGLLSSKSLRHATGRHADVVRESLPSDGRFTLYQDSVSAPRVERVYVASSPMLPEASFS
ncbi:Imm15 family immunity protein [Streptomyces sp. NPDC047108]|uniref:Imm15 family immunity protein n=1 Tax=Streptomyces sp. NPDC047108 TaxID=3155025 RepID=UPI0033FF8EE1